MRDLAHYLERCDAPDFSLVPDGDFPVSFAEMHILRFCAERKLSSGNLTSLAAGDAMGIIPDSAYAVLSDCDAAALESLAKIADISVEADGPGVRVRARGVSKHAAYPDGSVNAIGVLCDALTESGALGGEAATAIAFIGKSLKDVHGQSVGAGFSDPVFGRTTHAACKARLEDGVLRVWYNLRFPVSVDEALFGASLRDCFEAGGFRVSDMVFNEALRMDPAHPMLETLARSVDSTLHCGKEPYVMIGGTYARKLPNAAVFGLSVPARWTPDTPGRGDGHQPDEYAEVDMLLDGLRVYVRTLALMDDFYQAAV
jgi:succinyl-diaminopimelate desuccinylase